MNSSEKEISFGIIEYFGIAFISLFLFISLVVCFYIVVHYSHNQEKKVPWHIIFQIMSTVGFAIPLVLILSILIDYFSTQTTFNKFQLNYDMLKVWPVLMHLIVFFVYFNYFLLCFYQIELRNTFKRIQKALLFPCVVLGLHIAVTTLFSIYLPYVNNRYTFLTNHVNSLSSSSTHLN